MNRYLLHISYMGTFFKAFTKVKVDGPTTVGVIEEGLQLLKSKNPIAVQTISRTDAGVHALNSAVIVDLERANGKCYEDGFIASKLNGFFEESKYQIRINRVDIVPNNYNPHRRGIRSRTYLYRLGIVKPGNGFITKLEESERCLFQTIDKFDINKAREAAKLLEGYHDFRSFMNHNNDHHEKPSFAWRRINYLRIEQSFAHTIYPFEHSGKVEYYDITVNAPSFLYRQIRKIVGVLIAVAKGKMSKRDVYEMLTIPSKYTQYKGITAPSHGLYLTDIEFTENFSGNIVKNGELNKDE